MGKSSNDTVGRVRCPRGVSASGLGEVKKDGINITRVSINKVIFQGYLEGGFFGVREMRGDIFANGR